MLCYLVYFFFLCSILLKYFSFFKFMRNFCWNFFRHHNKPGYGNTKKKCKYLIRVLYKYDKVFGYMTMVYSLLYLVGMVCLYIKKNNVNTDNLWHEVYCVLCAYFSFCQDFNLDGYGLFTFSKHWIGVVIFFVDNCIINK